MATQTYAQLQNQIAVLQAQAERLKSEEVIGVIAKIKDAIASYGLTESDLFGGRGSASRNKKSSAKPASSQAKYADGNGGEWVGRGPRPQWLRDAIAGGRSLEEFAVGAGRPAPATKPPAAAGTRAKRGSAGKAAAKKAARAKFTDGAGNTWSGFGRQPKWMSDALAAGKTMDDLRTPD